MQQLDVLILMQENCGFCDEAKLLFQRLAREFPLVLALKDINSPEGQESALRGGVLFPPGIFIDGEPICYGRPSERGLRRAIDKRLASAKLARRPPASRPADEEAIMCKRRTDS